MFSNTNKTVSDSPATHWVSNSSVQSRHYLPGVSVRCPQIKGAQSHRTVPPSDTCHKSWATNTSDQLLLIQNSHSPSLGFDNLSEQLTELQKIFYFCLLVYYKGYNSEIVNRREQDTGWGGVELPCTLWACHPPSILTCSPAQKLNEQTYSQVVMTGLRSSTQMYSHTTIPHAKLSGKETRNTACCIGLLEIHMNVLKDLRSKETWRTYSKIPRFKGPLSPYFSINAC